MDTDKWKSILVPKDVYLEIKKIASKEGRTLGGQLRFIYSQYVSEEASTPKLYRASVIGPSEAFLPLPDKKTSTGSFVSG